MILYFSGTGNSKYVAKRIADALGDAVVQIHKCIVQRVRNALGHIFAVSSPRKA